MRRSLRVIDAPTSRRTSNFFDAVDPLDSRCCGTAESFGYEADHYDLSRAIERVLRERIEESDGEVVVAPGASCRTQVGDFEGLGRPVHPIEAAAALE